MPKIVRVSNAVNESLLASSQIDVQQLEATIQHELIQQLVHTLYASEVKTKPGIRGTVYYIELNIVSNDELEILERAMK